MRTNPRQLTSDTRVNLTGYSVRALDGRIGTVDEATRNPDELDMVVETGLFFFKKKRVIPAAAVTDIDPETETVHTSLTKSQVKYMPLYGGTDARKEGRSG